jgi:diguanylate cyclase (GGDEF)-like protein/PAS domain S-box-containing protein
MGRTQLLSLLRKHTMERDSKAVNDLQPAFLSRQKVLERQLDEVQRIGHVGIWSYDPASGRLVWSDETCRILGVDKARFDGSVETYVALAHPDDRDRVVAAIEEARHGPFVIDLEHRILLPSGAVRHVLARGAGYLDEAGTAVLAGTVHDITALRESSAALQAVSRKLLDTLENMGDGFYTLDRSWRYTYLNKEAERIMRRPREELLGKNVWEVYPDALGTPIESGYRVAMERRRQVAFEVFYEPMQVWKELRVFPTDEGIAVYANEITERKRLEEVERTNAERFKLVARVTNDIIWDWDIASDHIWWSEGAQAVFGYPAHAFQNGFEDWASRIEPHERARVVDGLFAAMHGGQESWRAEFRFRRQDGSYACVVDQAVFLRDASGTTARLIGSIVDVTEQRRAEAARRDAEARNRLQASLLDKAHDAIMVVSASDARLTYWNRGAERLFGWTAEEAVGKTMAELLIVNKDELARAHSTVLERDEWTGELIKRRKDGTCLTCECRMTLLRDDAGQPQSVLEFGTDISQRKQDERAIVNLAFFDPLTRLPNRRLLLDRLRHALATSKRDGHSGALLFLDLDNFKTLNDTLGHDKGDLLLKQVAARLTNQVPRESDTVARHGGDEFVIVLEALDPKPEEAAVQAEMVADKLLAAFEQPFQLDSYQHHTTPSIGVALFDKDLSDIDELLKRADLAMYQAKAAGRNTARFFDQYMQTVINSRVKLEAELRRGMQYKEFVLYYQRQTDSTGHTTGAEALLRWERPGRQAVSPSVFIPLAEETGLILQLGQWVLESACLQLVAWSRHPVTAGLTLAVNVSARQFRQPAFVDQVLDVIDRTGADPTRLKLELTESLLVANVEHTVESMHALKAKGIGFALDDFGTGYSSLAYLKRLPLDQLKIDQSFVRDVLSDPNDAAIARTILGLGQTLGLDVIAEGVENPSQRDFLAAHGCRAFQGYLFGRPVAAEQF